MPINNTKIAVCIEQEDFRTRGNQSDMFILTLLLLLLLLFHNQAFDQVLD